MNDDSLDAFTWTAVAFVLAQASAATAVSFVPDLGPAAAYPNHPIRLLVGLPPGGSTDAIARIVASKLGDALGQHVVVDNRTGASGLIASEIAARAPADGHTLLFGASFYSEVYASLDRRLPYDPVRDFAPISLVTKVPNVLVVHPALPVRTVADFIAHAKSRPGKLNYASAGNGSSAHLSMEMLKKQVGIDVVHVPYKGAPQALVDLLAGEISVMFGNVPTQIPHLKSGKTRALAVTGATRNFQLPDVPTMMEAGVPNFEITVWYGVFAPARVPPSILSVLNAALIQSLATPEVRERMAVQGAEPTPATRDEFAAFQKAEVAKWAKVVKDWGTTPK
jgi:tripartite-type tricarboxylate transporter receptor subunit TctC